ncbi:MAG: hypothetical protein ACYC2P_12635 [Paludibacteraceae bacterium]
MKTEEDDLLTYDDDEAVKFIINLVPEEMKGRVNDDNVNYVLDVLYDYYEEKGFIGEGTAEEASIDEEDMLKYVIKAAKKDSVELDEDEIQFILDAEYEYGKSLGIYTDDDEE